MPKQRKQVKKFTRFIYPARAARLNGLTQLRLHESIQAVLRSANAIYSMPRENNSRVIFVGQAARPLFESVRGLNEILGSFPRKDFRYFITFGSLGFYHHFSDYVESKERLTRWLGRKMRKQKIVTPGKKIYYIVDVVDEGRTTSLMKNAIMKLQPGAEARILHQDNTSKVIGKGIKAMSNIPRPTEKDWKGTWKSGKERQHSQRGGRWVNEGLVIRPSDLQSRQAYLVFENALQEWLEIQRRRIKN